MSGNHSILAPSSAARWVKCPASAGLAAAMRDESGQAATEGQLVHEIGAQLIDMGRRGVLPESAGSVAEYGWPELSPDQIEGALGYARAVVSVLRYLGIFAGEHMGTESRVEMPEIHASMHGTADAWVYSKRENTLIIWDLKWGFGPVSAFENWQMVCYASGILTRLGDAVSPETRVSIRIHQPRARQVFGVAPVWNTSVAELVPYFVRLRAAAELAMSALADSVPGTHCKNCRALPGCGAVELAALTLADYSAEPSYSELSPAELGQQLAVLEYAEKMIGYRADSLRTQAEMLFRAGGNVPGYRMERNRGSIAWKVSPETIGTIAAAYGVDVSKRSVITPLQAKKAGLDPVIVEMYSERGQGSQKLVPDDGTHARMIFGAKQEG